MWWKMCKYYSTVAAAIRQHRHHFCVCQSACVPGPGPALPPFQVVHPSLSSLRRFGVCSYAKKNCAVAELVVVAKGEG